MVSEKVKVTLSLENKIRKNLLKLVMETQNCTKDRSSHHRGVQKKRESKKCLGRLKIKGERGERERERVREKESRCRNSEDLTKKTFKML